MYLGLDFGTSGARSCVLDEAGNIVHEERIAYPDAPNQTPQDWRETLHALLKGLPKHIAEQLQRIAVDATSATVLLCDANLQPVSPTLLYNDARAHVQAEQLKQIAPAGHTVGSATSGLAKFLWLTQNTDLDTAAYFMHQADWLSALLSGNCGSSDYHYALKSGYDVEKLCWPAWVMQLPHSNLLPHVLAPGTFISQISPTVAAHFKLNPACTIHAGTTDSIAAFIAADVHEPGAAMTSLGSTIVLKFLSKLRIEDTRYGVYSHRYGDLWLAGGASNAGGAVLKRYFSDAQLEELSTKINTATDSTFDYYPLPKIGERFPINDPALSPRLSPRPTDDVAFLHGLLQSLSKIEATGYAKLIALGAPPLISITTCGKGASNKTWQKLRSKLLGVSIIKAEQTEAAFGVAILAKQGGIIPS